MALERATSIFNIAVNFRIRESNEICTMIEHFILSQKTKQKKMRKSFVSTRE